MENQLITTVKESGLDQTKAQVLIENFQGYFALAEEWRQKADAIQVTREDQRAEMAMARAGRLFLKEKRVAIEATRKQLKEASLREGQAIDNVAKILKNLIEPIEKDLEEKEKFAEIQEAKRIEALRIEREAEVMPYIEFIPQGLPLGKLSEKEYSAMLSGAKIQVQARKEQQEREEQERVKAAELAKRLQERRERLLPMKSWIQEFEKLDLTSMEDQEVEKVLEDAMKAMEEHRIKVAQVEAENERIKKEADKQAKIRAAEKQREEKELEAANERVRQAQEAAKKAQEEANRKLKEQADRLTEFKKAEEAARAKLAAEKKKADQAGDEEKLKVYFCDVANVPFIKNLELRAAILTMARKMQEYVEKKIGTAL
jgi:hypothetical protein